MLISLMSFFVFANVQAENLPSKVIASCECVVFNDAGVPIRPPHSYVGAPIPVVPGYFEVHGVGELSSEVERANCQEIGNGELNLACAVGAVKAQHNASYLCGEIARRYHPDRINGFQYGSVEPGSCFLSLD